VICCVNHSGYILTGFDVLLRYKSKKRSNFVFRKGVVNMGLMDTLKKLFGGGGEEKTEEQPADMTTEQPQEEQAPEPMPEQVQEQPEDALSAPAGEGTPCPNCGAVGGCMHQA
jgi:hypothetical protein